MVSLSKVVCPSDMLLTSPMRGQGSNTHCVCVCLWGRYIQ